ncbi:hypothetical protein Bca4012_026197 [Brassica carinata]
MSKAEDEEVGADTKDESETEDQSESDDIGKENHDFSFHECLFLLLESSSSSSLVLVSRLSNPNIDPVETVVVTEEEVVTEIERKGGYKRLVDTMVVDVVIRKVEVVVVPWRWLWIPEWKLWWLWIQRW